MSKAGESSIVSKCALVIDIVARAHKPLAFSDIVEQTGFVKSSTHRILAVLQTEDLIEYDTSSRTYRAGARLLGWGRTTRRRVDLQQVAYPHMDALCETTGMNVALSVFDRDSVLYLRTIDIATHRYASQAGDHAPLHCTAAGKVFLANIGERQREQQIANLKFEKHTERTILSGAELRKDLDAVKKRGFAMSLGEEMLQITGISAPVWNSDGRVTAALSIWAMSDTASEVEVVAASGQLIDAANNVSRELGWS